MRKHDRVIPAVAGVAVLAVAVLVVTLLRSAIIQGTEALEQAKLAQVQTTARSFDERVASSFSSLAGLGARPWELTLNSTADQAVLDTFAVDPEALSGSFLIDASDRVTSGVLLRPGMRGSTYAPAGWAEAKAALADAPAVVLPVSTAGMTTELPSYAFVVAIRGDAPTSLRGAFVFEQALTEDSTFSQEIGALVTDRSTTATWRFLDGSGTVVATTRTSGLGERVSDERLLELADGLYERDGDLIAIAEVPTVGWRVVFTQDHAEFVGPLEGPVQLAGLVLVLLLVGVAALLTGLLARRLQQSREEQRRLRELSRAQEEFISVVSHELRTPVAGILGFLQTSLDHWEVMGDDERRNAVRRAFTNARRLQSMTRDVLDTESIESGRFGYVRHRIDLAEEVRTAAEAFGADGAWHLVLETPDTPVMVDGDPDRLQQVLANLLDNARKNSPPESPVTLSLASTPTTARIVVEDRGAGIDPEALELVFEKFVRGRTGSVTGTGLGLYISRRIVEAHEGRIWAESSPGEPTRFIVEIPLSAAAA